MAMENENQVDENPTTIETPDEEFKVTKKYFNPSQVANGAYQNYFGKVAEIFDERDWTYNFDMAKEFPAGYGLYLLPIQETVKAIPGQEKAKRVLIGVACFAVPDFATVMADATGEAFVHECVLDKFGTKIKNSIAAEERTRGLELPFTLLDFVKRQTKGKQAEDPAFKAITETILKRLKQTTNMYAMFNGKNFRLCLSNANFAMQAAQIIEEKGDFDKILNVCITQAEKHPDADPELFREMLVNRHNVDELEDEDDIDFDTFGDGLEEISIPTPAGETDDDTDTDEEVTEENTAPT